MLQNFIMILKYNETDKKCKTFTMNYGFKDVRKK
jgi:hypothetical protein